MKTKNINGILCSYLKLIPYKGGLLAIDEEGEIREGDWFTWNSGYKQLVSNSRDGMKENPEHWFKILATTSSLSLPVWELPEKDDVEKLADKFLQEQGYTNLTGDDSRYKQVFNSFIAGYRAAGKSYSEEDMRKCWNASFEKTNSYLKENVDLTVPTFEDFLSSLHLKGVWVEVEEVKYFHGGGTAIAPPEYKFKITNNKLTVVEWD